MLLFHTSRAACKCCKPVYHYLSNLHSWPLSSSYVSSSSFSFSRSPSQSRLFTHFSCSSQQDPTSASPSASSASPPSSSSSPGSESESDPEANVDEEIERLNDEFSEFSEDGESSSSSSSSSSIYPFSGAGYSSAGSASSSDGFLSTGSGSSSSSFLPSSSSSSSSFTQGSFVSSPKDFSSGLNSPHSITPASASSSSSSSSSSSTGFSDLSSQSLSAPLLGSDYSSSSVPTSFDSLDSWKRYFIHLMRNRQYQTLQQEWRRLCQQTEQHIRLRQAQADASSSSSSLARSSSTTPALSLDIYHCLLGHIIHTRQSPETQQLLFSLLPEICGLPLFHHIEKYTIQQDGKVHLHTSISFLLSEGTFLLFRLLFSFLLICVNALVLSILAISCSRVC